MVFGGSATRDAEARGQLGIFRHNGAMDSKKAKDGVHRDGSIYGHAQWLRAGIQRSDTSKLKPGPLSSLGLRGLHDQ